MTVTALPVRDEYTATAAQTVFNYTFLIFTDGDLDVYITPSGQDANDATDITTAYTVDSGTIGNPLGGFITMNSGVSAGDLVTIVSSITEDRTVDYQNSGDFLPDTVNGDLDKSYSLIKQTLDRAGRTLAFEESQQNATELSLPPPQAGAFLKWKADETGVENSGAPSVVIPSEAFGVVADMVSSLSLSVGDMIFTLGYTTTGDGGGNQYLARATTGGPYDGGSLIDSAGNPAIEFVALFPGGLVNQVQFGCIGDDSFNNSPALQNMIDYAVSLPQVELEMLGGTYLMNTLVSVTTSALFLKMTGSGVNVTNFKASSTNTTGCFDFDLTDLSSIVTVSDMSFIANNPAGSGIALSITQPVGGNRHNRSVYLTNIEVKGDAVGFATDFWDVGIDLTGAWRPMLNSVLIGGPFGPGVSTDLSDSSPLFAMTAALNINRCYTPEIENCYFWSAATLIQCLDTSGGNEAEGFRLSHSVLNGCKVGVKYARTGQEPLLWITDCHINSRDVGIDLDGCQLFYLTGLNMYNEDLAQQTSVVGNVYSILLRNCDKGYLSGNMFHFNGNPELINIELNSAVACDQIMMTDNTFNSNSTSGSATAAINIGGGATNVVMENSTFPGTYDDNIIDGTGEFPIMNLNRSRRLSVNSQSDDNLTGPFLELYRDSSLPVDNDAGGGIEFTANDSNLDRWQQAIIRSVSVSRLAGAFTKEAQLEFFIENFGVFDKAMTISRSGATGDTSLFIMRNNGSNNTLQRVHVSTVADSGGAGFRLLRIAN